jgi:SPFH domain / Band 7 family
MLGFRFIKTEPTQYVIQYRNGRPVREGAGLAFWYFAPSTSMIVVPTASVNEPFIFPEITSDFQEVTIQGQITYRVTDPRRTAALLNFTFGPKGSYVSEDPKKLSQRLINQVQVAMRAEVQALSLKQVLASGEPLVERVAGLLQDQPTVKTLGLETARPFLACGQAGARDCQGARGGSPRGAAAARRRGHLHPPQRRRRTGTDHQGERTRDRDRG